MTNQSHLYASPFLTLEMTHVCASGGKNSLAPFPFLLSTVTSGYTRSPLLSLFHRKLGIYTDFPSSPRWLTCSLFPWDPSWHRWLSCWGSPLGFHRHLPTCSLWNNLYSIVHAFNTCYFTHHLSLILLQLYFTKYSTQSTSLNFYPTEGACQSCQYSLQLLIQLGSVHQVPISVGWTNAVWNIKFYEFWWCAHVVVWQCVWVSSLVNIPSRRGFLSHLSRAQSFFIMNKICLNQYKVCPTLLPTSTTLLPALGI